LFFEFPPDDPRYINSDLGPAGRVRLLDVSHPRTGTAEIWRTDGSREGTWKLLGLRVFDQVTATASWRGRRLLAIQSLESCSIWSTDGTSARKLFSLGSSDECPWDMADLGSRFLFLAPKAPRAGTQLFISDGTLAGTRQISSFQGDWEWAYFQRPAPGTGRVYFSLLRDGNTEIWSTGGTPRGTRREFAAVEAPNELLLFRGSFYLTGLLPDGEHRSLYRVPAGGGDPVLLAPVDSGSLNPLGDRLFFDATDAAHGTEPWVTDGTPEGTRLLADLLPGPGSSWPRSLAGDGHRLFFDARGVDGRELWETDGTAAGTRQVRDLAPGGASSSPSGLTLANGVLFFSADDGRTGVEPWALRLEP
jgi:ELWxxDGT repeat protein